MAVQTKRVVRVLFGMSCFIFGLASMYTYYRVHTQHLTNPFTGVAIKSAIIECNSIAKVLDYVHDESTLVVFDLDNTLVHPNQELGGDQWVHYMIKQKLAEGYSESDALKATLALYYKVQEFINLYPVEPETIAVLDILAQKKVPAIALTSRSLPIMHRTLEQLKQANVSFNCMQVSNKDLKFEMEYPAVVSRGIVFCSDNPKGKALFRFIELCSISPSAIIFVDDKMSHVMNVEQECLKRQVNFVGMRYGRLDKQVQEFNPKLAEQQLLTLSRMHPELPATA